MVRSTPWWWCSGMMAPVTSDSGWETGHFWGPTPLAATVYALDTQEDLCHRECVGVLFFHPLPHPSHHEQQSARTHEPLPICSGTTRALTLSVFAREKGMMALTVELVTETGALSLPVSVRLI